MYNIVNQPDQERAHTGKKDDKIYQKWGEKWSLLDAERGFSFKETTSRHVKQIWNNLYDWNYYLNIGWREIFITTHD